MDAAVITFERTFQFAEVPRSFKVFIDGEKVDRIWGGETRDVRLPPGTHTIQVALGTAQSPPLRIELVANQHARVRCARQGNLLTSLFWRVARPQALRIDRVDGAEKQPTP